MLTFQCFHRSKFISSVIGFHKDSNLRLLRYYWESKNEMNLCGPTYFWDKNLAIWKPESNNRSSNANWIKWIEWIKKTVTGQLVYPQFVYQTNSSFTQFVYETNLSTAQICLLTNWSMAQILPLASDFMRLRPIWQHINDPTFPPLQLWV